MTSEPPRTRRRLRSASVNLGALTVLALGLTGCNGGLDDDDDDDCAFGTTPRPTVSSTAIAQAAVPGYPSTAGADTAAAAAQAATAGLLPAALPGAAGPAATAGEALPTSGGFGTHLARGCGG